MKEIWKSVPSHVGIYEVSNLGNVRSLPKDRGSFKNVKGKLLRLVLNSRGRYRVALWKDGTWRWWPVSRLVLAAFIGPPPSEEHHADHVNGIKTDNRLTNLEWVTPEENNLRAINMGLGGINLKYRK